MRSQALQRGFTLIETIMVLVILAIVSSMAAVFIAGPVKGYLDSVRRAGLTDVADLPLKRISIDLRTAVPNSVRLRSTGASSVTSCTAAASSGCYLEYIPARTGGRYCADTDTGCNPLTTSTTSFDVLGQANDAASGEFLVVFNTGQSQLNAYTGTNLRTITAAGTSATAIAFSGGVLNFASPFSRYQVVPSSGPVTFACDGAATSGGNGTGTLKRYTGYASSPPFGAIQAAVTPATAGATSVLLADNVSACQMVYDALSASNGVVGLQITITRANESATLFHQIHVDNMP